MPRAADDVHASYCFNLELHTESGKLCFFFLPRDHKFENAETFKLMGFDDIYIIPGFSFFLLSDSLSRSSKSECRKSYKAAIIERKKV